VLLERHYELAREMKLYEKIAIDDLSVDDISCYLKLRREYEELQNKVGSLLPSVLEKIKEFLLLSHENLNRLSSITGNAFLMKDFLEIIGELEADAQKMQAKSSHLREMVDRQKGGHARPVQSIAIKEAACALEEFKPMADGGKAEEKGKEEQKEKVLVSPGTIKKIEEMVRPKGHAETEKVVKIATPRDSKIHPPAKANKESAKR